MTDNKMLLKEFSKIYTSCNKAKQGAIVEISKIDEKYRKLAEKEKEQLNELVKALESQMEMYGKYLGLVKTEDEPVQEDVTEAVVEEEPAIEDTIFPENNEPEQVEEKTEEPEKKGLTQEDIVAGLEAAGIVNLDEVIKEEKKEEKTEEAVVLEDIPEVGGSNPNMEWPDNDNLKLDESGWPEWPEA